METRNIRVKAPHPSPPPQGGREFQAYHYCGNAITTSNISRKLLRKTLKYEEAKLIGEILGYELKFIRTRPYV